jgi:glycogen debranching enzyme
MALEVTVGPPVLTINNGYTFLVTELDGSITHASDQGLYARDTRFLSDYQLYVNGKACTLLNSEAIAFYASRTHLVNPAVAMVEGVIPPGSVGLVLSRTLGEALHEDLDITNYSSKYVHFILEVLIRSDFADIFEVKARKLFKALLELGGLFTQARGQLRRAEVIGRLRQPKLGVEHVPLKLA